MDHNEWWVDMLFAMVVMWVSILNLPFGWMNDKRGARATSLVGEVMKIAAEDGDCG
jgi:hypothetical protein